MEKMYKVLFILSCAMLASVQLQAQSKKPVKAPSPPKLISSYSIMQDLKDPLEQLYVAFKTDPIYLKTDSAFIVQEMYFNPNGFGGGRISINNAMYPANYTKDSLTAKAGNVVLAGSIETSYKDGKYHYDGKYPKKSKKIIFVNDKDKMETAFTIVWNISKAEAKKIPIKSLVEDKTKRSWKVSEPLPIYPSM
jgi:hypothetical protein